MNSELFEMYRAREEFVLPELEGLGWCRTLGPRFGGPRTDGRDGYEIGYLHRGSVEWWTEDGLDEAGPGSLIVDWPGDWHGGVNAIVHPCERFWVRFNFPPAGRLPGLAGATIEGLEVSFAAMKKRHFPASPAVKTYFEQLIGQQRQPGQFAEDVSRAAFHQVLFAAVDDHHRDQQASYSPAVRQALARFKSAARTDCRVEDVARDVNLSVGYFYELFVREVGVTPGQYHQHQRVNAAKRELIYTDTPITALAMELGFSSSQYFATTFKKVVGLTPGEYRTLRENVALVGRDRAQDSDRITAPGLSRIRSAWGCTDACG